MVKLPYGWDSAVQAAKEANGNGSLNNMQIAASIILELDSQLRSPTQTKTVADAVEWHKSGNIINRLMDGTVFICEKDGEYHAADENSSMAKGYDGWSVVCTISEFEAYVKEQEGEKWTHTNSHGEKFKFDFKLACGERVYLREDGERIVDGKLGYSKLKPIKPTITKAEAWDKVIESKERKESGLSAITDKVTWVIENYEII